jgi:hypothetical protein
VDAGCPVTGHSLCLGDMWFRASSEYAPSVPCFAYGVVGESAMCEGRLGEEDQAGQEY